MKLNFNAPLKGLDGKEIMDNGESANMGKLLGNAIASQASGDVLKFSSWAMDMYQGKIIDLDKSDQETLKKFIQDNQMLTILAKGQLFEVFDKAK